MSADELNTIQSSLTLSEFDGSSSTKLSCDEISELKSRILKESCHSQKMCILDSNELDFSVPSPPEWIQSHYLPSLAYSFDDNSSEAPAPLGETGVNTQEYHLIDDLLSLMVGCPGTYITVKNEGQDSLTFDVDSSVEPCLKALVQRILPLCRHYSSVVNFMDRTANYEEGAVNQALSAAFKSLIKDYMLLVIQLESQHMSGALTLHRFWFYIEKTLAIMELVSSIAVSINKSKSRGGAVLSILYERTLSLSGFGQLQDILSYLTEASAIPFMEMLSLWIYRGSIVDPYREFIVQDDEEQECKESKNSDSFFFADEVEQYDDYWEKRYSVKRENVPTFLSSFADLILRSGKYLNVIRDSDPSIRFLEREVIVYKFDDKSFTDVIEKTYNFASKRLLQLLMKEKDLLGHLRSIKHYFLMDESDFVAQLLSLCGTELEKNIDDVFPSRLESLLELALRTSSANSHIYKDNVTCTLLPYSLMSQMLQILSIETTEEPEYRHPPDRLELTGLEGFTLSYKVQWPLLLVIDRKSHFCYQMIFRHFLLCKYVERLLRSVWMNNKVAKAFQVSSAATYRKALMLTQRMIYFIQNLEYYMFFEVVERNWANFLTKIQTVENIDEVLSFHSDFLRNCMKECMLQSPELLHIVIKIANICINFSKFILQSSVPEGTGLPDPSDSFEQTVARYDLQFNAMIVTLVDKISDVGRETYNDALIHGLYRLDFNGYYIHKSELLRNCSSPSNASSG